MSHVQTLREQDASSPSRPSTRLDFRRAATPSRQSSIASTRPSTSLETRTVSKRKSFLGLFSRKRRIEHASPEPAPPDPVKLNFLFVGSRRSGQTSLLFRSRYGYFPDTRGFARPLYETYTSDRVCYGIPATIELWDTSGVTDLNTIQLLSYINWDAIFLCFDISDKISMYTIVQWWQHTSGLGFTKPGSPGPQVYLVGLKKDLRDQCFLVDHRKGAAYAPSGLMAYPTCCVCPSEARLHTKRIGNCNYLECSAATGQGIDELFNKAVWEAVGGIEYSEREINVPQPKKRRLFS